MTADHLIAALNAFEAGPDDDEAMRLNDLLDGFDALDVAVRQRALPALFAVMERCADADLGSPGPLVHAIESLDVADYLPALVASVRRRPTTLNVWMVNRVLNATTQAAERAPLLAVLKETLAHPLGAPVADDVRDFLDHQGEPG